MAMSAATLGAALANAAGSTDAAGIAAWLAVATEIVAHIQTATVTVSVSSLTAVATGAMGGGAGVPVAGTGTGTATIT